MFLAVIIFQIKGLELKEQKVYKPCKTIFIWDKSKVVEEIRFLEFSITQLSQHQKLDCDMHAEPPTQTDYNEIILEIERNNYDIYKKAQVKIFKKLIRLFKYHNLDILKKTF